MVTIIMAVVLAAASPATAASPTETVKAAVQQVFSQPDSPAVKAPSVAERRAQIRKVTETLFDFEEMSQRSLGKAWTQASPAEQKEFVRLFGGLIANAYMGRIEQYAGEPITYVGERIEGDDARVQSRVVTPKGSEVPIEYRLYRSTEGRWTVYDIYVDGFSLVGSYKAQFNRLLQRGTFADLLKQLRQKTGS
ncbi:MAG TPA: ABC transporter substrate-binding protein [Methylomirabilota bacterium]